MNEYQSCPTRRPVKLHELTCSKCGVDLKLGENWNESRQKSRNYQCNKCFAEYHNTYYHANKDMIKARMKAWRADNRTYNRITEAARRYRSTKEEITELLKDADCMICGSTTKLVVDHDHVTGNIRGILCHNCNVGLGHFKDNPELLDKAWEYLNG